ncbi:Metallo-dependent hydrolase [Coniophora puteana RWD-64-598 SS2]|uniref:Probable guanine deaminase n=1 Tax=Coniophora puteana (strain RWD-64-598) TaxID=741705 RepID=A0A5M3N0N1_CONPW|nr:Metallo-dependent hydrolase [Coniophora puteana RWD-64-598 SS2]EIW84949.1 Metallo-dependent hydrolase [Coniophora puteana RWD-64-598 SS2]
MTIVFYGPVISPTNDYDEYTVDPRCLLVVSDEGTIEWLDRDVQDSMVQQRLFEGGLSTDGIEIITLKNGEFLIPGFIDTHIHACQVPNMGIGGDKELLSWLRDYTFPLETQFGSPGFAERIYPDVVRRIIESGTTTACYYGSLHSDATKTLATIINNKGQRAFVGKCNMDHKSDGDSEYHEKSAQDSIDDTKALFKHIHHLRKSADGTPFVYPILTPRFALSCTEHLLELLKRFVEENDNPSRPLAIQTHISENMEEVEETLQIFKDCSSYAAVYQKYGLLRRGTILGHGVYLTDDEMTLIAKQGAGVAHCPTSNFYLSSGMAQVGKLLDHDVKVGLGTDVSGGYSLSMLTTIRNASNVSKMLFVNAQAAERRGEQRFHAGKRANRKLTVANLLHLATLGGAKVCNLEKQIGSLDEGKAFDALLVSVRDETGNPAVWGYNPHRDSHNANTLPDKKTLRIWLERFLFCGDDRNIRKVFVQGRLIGGKEA